jgi:hypothetical protein
VVYPTDCRSALSVTILKVTIHILPGALKWLRAARDTTLMYRRSRMATDAIPSCWICGKPVLLEDCKIDERGLAVHENCYLAKVVSRKEQLPSEL